VLYTEARWGNSEKDTDLPHEPKEEDSKHVKYVQAGKNYHMFARTFLAMG
jgi:hypothetical protein